MLFVLEVIWASSFTIIKKSTFWPQSSPAAPAPRYSIDHLGIAAIAHHPVAQPQEVLSHVGSVLARDAGDQGCFHGWAHSEMRFSREVSRDAFNPPLGSDASGASLPWINRHSVSPWKVGSATDHPSLRRLQGIRGVSTTAEVNSTHWRSGWPKMVLNRFRLA